MIVSVVNWPYVSSRSNTIANKKLMEATDKTTQVSRQEWLKEAAADPVKAKDFFWERAMIKCVRDSLPVV